MPYPTPGRVVRFVSESNPELAATVIYVHNENIVNLAVFTDGTQEGAPPVVTKTWVTGNTEPVVGTWHWPVIEG